MSLRWEHGSDHRWRVLRAAVLRLDKPPSMRPPCAIAKPGVCTYTADCVDHITPLAMGGRKYDRTNVRPACTPCNLDRRHEQPRDEPPNRVVSSW